MGVLDATGYTRVDGMGDALAFIVDRNGERWGESRRFFAVMADDDGCNPKTLAQVLNTADAITLVAYGLRTIARTARSEGYKPARVGRTLRDLVDQAIQTEYGGT